MPIANFKAGPAPVKKECGCNGTDSSVSEKCCGQDCNCNNGCAGVGKCCGCVFVKKLKIILIVVFLFCAIFLLGTLIRNNLKQYKYIGQAPKMERTILVSGYGKVSGNNDIAVTTVGYSNVGKDVSKAQLDNKKVMDNITAELKKLGVADKDMQTNYTIYPEYNYTQDRGQELKGYRVNNQITIKIRNLANIPTILGLAGKYGATEVSGLSFTIDDPENLKEQARKKSLQDAKAKAQLLADKLGVKLGNVVSYNEYEGGGEYYPKAYSSTMMEGMGGGIGGGAPDAVASGSKDVVMNTTVTYEILPR